MIVAYFETPNHGHAEAVGFFKSEEVYMACVPALEKQAKKIGMILTESCENKKIQIIQIIEL